MASWARGVPRPCLETLGKGKVMPFCGFPAPYGSYPLDIAIASSDIDLVGPVTEPQEQSIFPTGLTGFHPGRPGGHSRNLIKDLLSKRRYLPLEWTTPPKLRGGLAVRPTPKSVQRLARVSHQPYD